MRCHCGETTPSVKNATWVVNNKPCCSEECYNRAQKDARKQSAKERFQSVRAAGPLFALFLVAIFFAWTTPLQAGSLLQVATAEEKISPVFIYHEGDKLTKVGVDMCVTNDELVSFLVMSKKYGWEAWHAAFRKSAECTSYSADITGLFQTAMLEGVPTAIGVIPLYIWKAHVTAYYDKNGRHKVDFFRHVLATVPLLPLEENSG